MKQFFARFSRRTWIITGVVMTVLLAIGYFSTRGESAPLFQTTKVERGNLVATVGATGRWRAKQRAPLIWQTSGIVQAVNVEVGSRVSQDEVLASLDKTSLSQNIILAEADLLSAKKALEDLLTSDTARLEALAAVDKAEKAYEKAYNWRMKLNGKIDITDYFYDLGVLKVRQYRGIASPETIATADKELALAESRLADARRAYDRLLGGAASPEVAAAQARV